MLNRRHFLITAASFTAALALPKIAFAKALKLIDPTGKKRTDAENKAAIQQATALNYVSNLDSALKTDKYKKLYKDKAGVAAKDQHCDACMFYQCVNSPANAGKCTLFPTVLVHAKGSCLSWTKAPAKKPCVANA